MENPFNYFKSNPDWKRPKIMSHPERINNETISHNGYDIVCLTKGELVKGQGYVKLEFEGKIYQFINFEN